MILEVAVRNAIDEQLKPWNKDQGRNVNNSGFDFTDEWIAHPAIPLHGLMSAHSKNAQSYAQTARGKRPPHHPRKRAPISHDDLLAQLSFGTWTSILPNPNRPRVSTPKIRIWEEAIVYAFPKADPGDAGIRQVCEPLKRLHNLRNQVRHGINVEFPIKRELHRCDVPVKVPLANIRGAWFGAPHQPCKNIVERVDVSNYAGHVEGEELITWRKF